MNQVTPCEERDLPVVADIINESALAYKGVIPADRWHEPYMPLPELEAEVARGVRFYAYRNDEEIIGVMGVQDVKDVTLSYGNLTRGKTACSLAARGSASTVGQAWTPRS